MQFVKFRWETSGLSGEPFLFLREGNKLGKVRMMEQDIRIEMFEKTCIGYNKKSKHYDCPKSREVSDERMCNECMLNDDFFMCVKCDGSECINDPQRSNCAKMKYYIYLAAFSNVLKVGISQEHRILERLIEQGADMGAKIGMVTDGKLAREVEQKIRKELGIADRMRGIEKQKLLFGNPNSAAINIFNAFAKLRANGVSKYLMGPEIYNLQGLYRLSSVTSQPQAFVPEYGAILEGRVVAAKGNIIVLKDEKGFTSFDANKLIGYRSNVAAG